MVGPAGSRPHGRSVTDLVDRLNDLGYAWNTESEIRDQWIKGTPSLMQFAALRAASENSAPH